jgi:fucose permease
MVPPESRRGYNCQVDETPLNPSPAEPVAMPYSPAIMAQPVASRRALAGLFLSGLFLAFPGVILVAWDYHRSSDYAAMGLYFLFMNLGVLAAVQSARLLLKKRGIKTLLASGCLLAAACLIVLAFTPPPAPVGWRWAALFGMGAAAGLLNAGVFQLLAVAYERAPAATMNLAGILFGGGCLAGCLLVGAGIGTYGLWLPVALFAVVSAGYGLWYLRRPFPAAIIPDKVPTARAVEAFRSPAAILLALLLFFQFGSEWAIAAWLPLFLVQRLGVSPGAGLWLLSLYWLAIVLGRILIQPLLQRFRHGRLLMSSVLAALFGCMILAFTNNLPGAGVAVVATGLGFAAVYPLVVERVGARFSYYHPVYFNGIFSVAFTGGLLAPWLVGMLASVMGIGAVMLVAVVGTLAVFVLLILIWIESKLNPL